MRNFKAEIARAMRAAEPKIAQAAKAELARLGRKYPGVNTSVARRQIEKNVRDGVNQAIRSL